MGPSHASLPRRGRLSWTAVVGTCAALLSVDAMALDVRVARSVLEVPGSVQAQALALRDLAMAGDGNLVIERKLVRWTPAEAATPSYVLIESVASGGSRYEWNDSCASLKGDDTLFVHRPFHATRDQCVIAAGPLALAELFARFHKDVAAMPAGADWTPSGEGYFVRATMSIASGAHMAVTAYVPGPFAGGGPDDTLPRHDARFPAHVAAWAMALNRQVESSVLSLSGKWQLPPIKQPQ